MPTVRKPDYYIFMTELSFTYLKSTIETIEKDVKYVQS